TVSQIVPAKAHATYHLTARTRRVPAEHVAQHNDGSSQRLVLEFLDADKTLLTNPHCKSVAKYCHATYTVDPPMSTTKFAKLSIGTAQIGVEAPAGAHYVRVTIKANGTQGEYRDWDNIILKQVGWGGE